MRALESDSLQLDRTIHRLTPFEIDTLRDLRAFAEWLGASREDLLVYASTAKGAFGDYRLVAFFPGPPDTVLPIVLCLDGPRGMEASEHRYFGPWLCLYYPGDPPERRWKLEDGLLRLFDIARRHVFGEHVWRQTGKWPIAEAPHGECAPAAHDPSIAVGPLGGFRGRNQPCPCGSGLKAKKCIH